MAQINEFTTLKELKEKSYYILKQDYKNNLASLYIYYDNEIVQQFENKNITQFDYVLYLLNKFEITQK